MQYLVINKTDNTASVIDLGGEIVGFVLSDGSQLGLPTGGDAAPIAFDAANEIVNRLVAMATTETPEGCRDRILALGGQAPDQIATSLGYQVDGAENP